MVKRLHIEEVIDKMYLYMKQKADTLLDETYHELCAEFDKIHDITDDAYTIYVQFKAMACIVRAHIYAENDDAIQYELQMIDALYTSVQLGVLSDSQLIKITELVNAIARECNDFVRRSGYDIECPDIIKNFGKIESRYADIDHEKLPPHKCYLCQTNDGVFKGSHMAPNFLIQPFLSYDNSSKRDKEIITEVILRDDKKARKWGRSVGEDVIKENFGDVPDEELVRIKSNALTRDDFFCHECEDRFGYYESIYSDYFCKRKISVAPEHSYLFWLGVFWRLSVSNMCFKMSENDEESARKILDATMPYSIHDAKKTINKDHLGDFCYTIIHCYNIKGERRAVLGNHTNHAPYKLVVGEYIVTLYSTKEQVDTVYPLNNYTHAEQIAEVSFIDYWKQKQKIMEETEKREMSNMGMPGTRLTDIIYGGDDDKLDKVFSPAGKTIQDSVVAKENAKYGISIPGALMKLMSYEREHPFDSPEELWEGFEKQYGYTKDEMEEILTTFSNQPIFSLRSDEERARHKRRQQRSKEKQRKNRKKRK